MGGTLYKSYKPFFTDHPQEIYVCLASNILDDAQNFDTCKILIHLCC